MQDFMTLRWTVLLTRGLIGIAFGGLAMAWPEETVTVPGGALGMLGARRRSRDAARDPSCTRDRAEGGRAACGTRGPVHRVLRHRSAGVRGGDHHRRRGRSHSSSSMDMRSFGLNSEISLMVHSHSLVAQMREVERDYREQAPS